MRITDQYTPNETNNVYRSCDLKSTAIDAAKDNANGSMDNHFGRVIILLDLDTPSWEYFPIMIDEHLEDAWDYEHQKRDENRS